MDKIIKDILFDLGLTEKEIKFFITNYYMGPSPINVIAKQANIERSTAYLLAQTLIKKGLLLEDYKQYKKLLTAVEPKTLLRMLAAKQRQIGRHEIAFKENLAELQALYQSSEVRPKVRTYEGKSGLLAIRRDILAISQEVLLWTNQETESIFFNKDYHQHFIEERLRKKIPIRVLAVTNKHGKVLIKNSASFLRQVKLLPREIFFSAETYIYGDKIAVIDYNKDIMGIIVESKQIVQAQRAIFEMNWQQLPKVSA